MFSIKVKYWRVLKIMFGFHTEKLILAWVKNYLTISDVVCLDDNAIFQK